MTEIIALGEILIDLTQTGAGPGGVPQFAAYPGGAPANVAVAAARLGARTAFVGRAGRDGLGDYLARVLAENGVDPSGLRRDRAATTLAVVTVDAAGERDFTFLRGADACLAPEDLDPAALAGSKFLHTGSVSLTAAPAREAVWAALRRARAAGVLVSYDPNYRPALWPDPARAAEEMARPLPLVDLVKLSREELPLLTGEEDLEAGTARLRALGVSLVLVTLGPQGVCYRLGEACGRVAGVPVRVADTNGAGDTFLGAVLARLCRRGDRPLAGLTPGELEPILAFANRAAALTCSRRGAIPAMPTLAELGED